MREASRPDIQVARASCRSFIRVRGPPGARVLPLQRIAALPRKPIREERPLAPETCIAELDMDKERASNTE